MPILITGVAGFIGSVLCSRLASGNKVIGVDITGESSDSAKIAWEQADLTDLNVVAAICEKHSPDVVIHCAGIAHQKIGAVDLETYLRMNSEATENLAKAASQVNPAVHFIFFSSVSVYGEGPQITPVKYKIKDHLTGQAQINADSIHRLHRYTQKKKNSNEGVGEDSECYPSSDYAFSKLDAERRLVALADGGVIRNLIILRLSPVYDREWSLNLDRRVFAPGKLAYLRFGSGLQRMSALARPNLVDFLEFIMATENPQITQIRADKNNIKNNQLRQQNVSAGNSVRQNNPYNQRNLRIFNVCDAEPYEFNKVIQVFKNSGIRPSRPVISVPLPVVWFATRIAGRLFPGKRKWLHSCYEKLATSLVFDNTKMLKTGFKPRHSLETIFNPQIKHLTQRCKDAKKKTI